VGDNGRGKREYMANFNTRFSLTLHVQPDRISHKIRMVKLHGGQLMENLIGKVNAGQLNSYYYYAGGYYYYAGYLSCKRICNTFSNEDDKCRVLRRPIKA
jgi:hypothetical protein